uniref:long-chain-fatty-acid--CoA ligase n=1 Tax=Cyclopterus lumpus TaxID=8103 RepID=A0A8C2WCH9_CYCLU
MCNKSTTFDQRCLQSSHNQTETANLLRRRVSVWSGSFLTFLLLLFVIKYGCPCCPDTEEPRPVPLVRTNGPAPLAPADDWGWSVTMVWGFWDLTPPNGSSQTSAASLQGKITYQTLFFDNRMFVKFKLCGKLLCFKLIFSQKCGQFFVGQKRQKSKIYSNSCKKCVFTFLYLVYSFRGLATGIYTTNSAEACQYVAANSEANILVVENQKQLDKILQVKDHLPHLKAIVQYKGELQQKAPFLYTWAEFMKLGEEVPDEQLNAVIDSLRANECCTLIFTSGTTGNPKACMLSHDNVIHTAASMVNLKYAEEVMVSYLPLSHAAAQLVDMWLGISCAMTTYFAEPDALKGSLVNTLKEVRPTCFVGVPRVWEKMQEKMKAVGAKASPMRSTVAGWAKSIGLRYNYSNQVPWGFMLANNLVFKKVRESLGLDRCKLCFTGAAPITKDTLEYFMSLNIPLLELYGMSESSCPHTISTDTHYHLTSCGKKMPGSKTKLENPDEDGSGEICMWGRHVFMGYLDMPDLTAEALDQDGWLHSGDLGRHDQNDFLYITGRIKELIITAGGENIPPVPIEDSVKAEVPIISNAMLIGDKLKFLSMLLTLKCVVDDNGEPTDELSPEALIFCQHHNVTATKVSEIVANKEPAIYNAIQEGMERANARATSNAQKIQKWTILERDFSVNGGELGPTMKLRRPIVVKMYQEKINELYAVATETQQTVQH